GGRSATSMSTEPDGRFSTYIIPNRVGTHQVEVESRDRSSTASVQVLPTVAVNSVGVPNNVFEGRRLRSVWRCRVTDSTSRTA
ncbi:hypothetical protein HRED_08271, partial [Candidatus Haloredivivus sp. G17]